MKRFHVHVTVDNLDAGIAFYSKLFGGEPTLHKPDYAKWMLEDPRLNFALSARGGKPGVDHLGFQLDSDEEFRAMHAQLAAADAAVAAEVGAHCCYATSDKYWVTDPSGVPWETYHTLGSIPMFGGDESANACCGSASATTSAAQGCCSPALAVIATIPGGAERPPEGA